MRDAHPTAGPPAGPTDDTSAETAAADATASADATADPAAGIDMAAAERIGGHIDASPTPFHAVEHAVGLLTAAGGRLAATAVEAASAGLWYEASAGSLTAWCVGQRHGPRSGFRIAAAHTDSPNLRVKPRPDRGRGSCGQIGVEVYGSALVNSWLDRDLGVAGRLAVRDGAGGAAARLVRIDGPWLRIPQLAIHLDRGIDEHGLRLNRQLHLSPIWTLDPGAEAFLSAVAAEAGVAAADVVGHDLMLFDPAPSRLVGPGGDMLSASRIDNLVSCFAAVEALIDAAAADEPGSAVPMVCLFDHEEVGSVSATGAASPRLANVLERLSAGFGASADDGAAARAASLVLSADGAHATHPNYPDRHEPEHLVALNGGPVLKVNANQRYATDALTGAAFRLACERVGAPVQLFVNRSDLACGSTIGPVTAGRLGIGVVDAGCPQLAMHSIRELAGRRDVAWFRAAVAEFLRG